MRKLLACCFVAFFALAFTTDTEADQSWPNCQKLVSGLDAGGGNQEGIALRMGCEELLVEDVLETASDSLKEQIGFWEADWKALRFPPRIFRYTLVVGNFGEETDILLADTENEHVFLRSAYLRIARSFIFRLPECHRQTISFLSPYPPKVWYVTPFWSATHPSDQDWGGNSDSPMRIAIPSAWNSDRAHMAEITFSTEKNVIEPIEDTEWSPLRCTERPE